MPLEALSLETLVPEERALAASFGRCAGRSGGREGGHAARAEPPGSDRAAILSDAAGRRPCPWGWWAASATRPRGGRAGGSWGERDDWVDVEVDRPRPRDIAVKICVPRSSPSWRSWHPRSGRAPCVLRFSAEGGRVQGARSLTCDATWGFLEIAVQLDAGGGGEVMPHLHEGEGRSCSRCGGCGARGSS